MKKGGLGRLFVDRAWTLGRYRNSMVAAAIMVNVAITGITTVITAVSRYASLCVNCVMVSMVMTAPQWGSESKPPAATVATRCYLRVQAHRDVVLRHCLHENLQTARR